MCLRYSFKSLTVINSDPKKDRVDAFDTATIAPGSAWKSLKLLLLFVLGPLYAIVLGALCVGVTVANLESLRILSCFGPMVLMYSKDYPLHMFLSSMRNHLSHTFLASSPQTSPFLKTPLGWPLLFVLFSSLYPVLNTPKLFLCLPLVLLFNFPYPHSSVFLEVHQSQLSRSRGSVYSLWMICRRTAFINCRIVNDLLKGVEPCRVEKRDKAWFEDE